jgi:hypothetical protein
MNHGMKIALEYECKQAQLSARAYASYAMTYMSHGALSMAKHNQMMAHYHAIYVHKCLESLLEMRLLK